jgi:hypothetical protein
MVLILVTRTPVVPILMVVSHALVMLAGTLVETAKKVHVIMSTNVPKLSSHTSVVTTLNVSIPKAHMNVNVWHHSIWLMALVLTMMNVPLTATTATRVDQSAQMKPRPTQWNGLMVLQFTL